MRTTLDLPDLPLRHLKSRAALEGTTLKELVRTAIERSLSAAPSPVGETRVRSTLPSLELGRPLRAKWFSNAGLCAQLDE